MKMPSFFNKGPSMPFYVFIAIFMWLVFNFLYKDDLHLGILSLTVLILVLGLLTILSNTISKIIDHYVLGNPNARDKPLHTFFSSILNNLTLMLYMLLLLVGVFTVVEYFILYLFGYSNVSCFLNYIQEKFF